MMILFDAFYILIRGKNRVGRERAAHIFLTLIQAGIISSFIDKISCVFFSMCHSLDNKTQYKFYYAFIAALVSCFNVIYYNHPQVDRIIDKWERRSMLKNYLFILLFIVITTVYFLIILSIK